MATASGNSEGTRKSVMPGVAPMVAYAVVLALLVAAGVIVFVAGSGSGSGGKAGAPARDTASRPTAAADIEAVRTARALKLPPRSASSEGAPVEKAPPEKTTTEMAAEPASTSSSQAEPEKKPEPLKIETAKAEQAKAEQAKAEQAKTEQAKTEPGKIACKVDLTRWPTDKSDQAQAVQMMLRDLGYYRGTTNGTVGPQTRTAIREFQGAAAEGDAGEVSEALFEALKKKCAASP